MDNLPRRGHNEQRWMFWKRRRHLVAFLAFLGFFTVNLLRSNFFNAVNPMRTLYNVTLDNGTVVEKQDVTWNFWEIFTILRAFIFGNAVTQILGGWLGACLGGTQVFGVAVALSALFSLVTPFLVNMDVVNILIAIRFIGGLFEAVETHLGFVIIGEVPFASPSPLILSYFIYLLSTNDLALHQCLQTFWQQEQSPHAENSRHKRNFVIYVLIQLTLGILINVVLFDYLSQKQPTTSRNIMYLSGV
ncbi:hypothetical protein J6590_008647 [Homalodisca vitripennis]|nr:hypothetical protein J6590_008647 [Homalodisca vitripennis]